MAAVTNRRSQAVMRRIGMTRDPVGDFAHLDVPPGPLRRTVIYRIGAAQQPERAQAAR
jgi:RimJ/RimL family protein N-acetyltransferase